MSDAFQRAINQALRKVGRIEENPIEGKLGDLHKSLRQSIAQVNAHREREADAQFAKDLDRYATQGFLRHDKEQTAEDPEGLWPAMSKGFKAGVEEVPALLQAAGGAMSKGAGFEKQGDATLKDAAEELMRIDEKYKVQGIPQHFSDLDFSNPSQVGTWVVYNLARTLPIQIPLLAATGGAGNVAKLATTATLRRMSANAAKSYVKNKTKAGTIEAYVRKRALQGAAAGGFVGAEALALGEVSMELLAETGQVDIPTALAFSTAVAALDTALPVYLFDKMGLGMAARQGIMKDLVKTGAIEKLKNTAKKAGLATVGGMWREGATEGLQTIIEKSAVKWVDENKDIFTRENMDEVLDSVVIGGLFGAKTGMFAGAIEGAQDIGAQKRLQKARELLDGPSKKLVQDSIQQAVDASPRLTGLPDDRKADAKKFVLDRLAEPKELNRLAVVASEGIIDASSGQKTRHRYDAFQNILQEKVDSTLSGYFEQPETKEEPRKLEQPETKEKPRKREQAVFERTPDLLKSIERADLSKPIQALEEEEIAVESQGELTGEVYFASPEALKERRVRKPGQSPLEVPGLIASEPSPNELGEAQPSKDTDIQEAPESSRPAQKAKPEQAKTVPPGPAIIAAEGTPGSPVEIAKPQDMKKARARVEPHPSPGQIEAGNYRKGYINVHDAQISLETAKGGTRKSKPGAKEEWQVKMPVDYGQIQGTEAPDGDPVDVFIGPDPTRNRAYVINQVSPKTGKYDEPKIMLGFNTAKEARAAYLNSFSEGFGKKTFGSMRSTSARAAIAWAKTNQVRSRSKPFKPETARRALRAQFKRRALETEKKLTEAQRKLGIRPRRQEPRLYSVTPKKKARTNIIEDVQEISQEFADQLQQLQVKGQHLTEVFTRLKTLREGDLIPAYKNAESREFLTQLAQDLVRLAAEGEAGREWYENSSRSILKAFNGNRKKAELFVQLLAIYSPQTNVPTNLSFAITAWNRYQSTGKIFDGDEVATFEDQIAHTGFNSEQAARQYMRRNGFVKSYTAEIAKRGTPKKNAGYEIVDNKDGTWAVVRKAHLAAKAKTFQEDKMFAIAYDPQARPSTERTVGEEPRIWKVFKVSPTHVNIKSTAQDLKAHLILADGLPFDGRKTNNFYINLMRLIDPEMVQGVTSDLWMSRAFGFLSDQVSIPEKFDLIETVTRKLGHELGWGPHQVQAAIWVAMKARQDRIRPEIRKEAKKRGLVESKVISGSRQLVPIKEKEGEYGQLVRDMTLGADLDISTFRDFAGDFSDFIKDNLAVTSVESVVSESLDHLKWTDKSDKRGIRKSIADLDDLVKADHHKRIMEAFQDQDGNDAIAEALGLVGLDVFTGPGYWEGKSNPMDLRHWLASGSGGLLKPEIRQMLNDYVIAVAMLLKQDGVGWVKPFPVKAKKDANLLKFKLYNRKDDSVHEPTKEDMLVIGDALDNLDYGWAEMASKDGFYVFEADALAGDPEIMEQKFASRKEAQLFLDTKVRRKEGYKVRKSKSEFGIIFNRADLAKTIIKTLDSVLHNRGLDYDILQAANDGGYVGLDELWAAPPSQRRKAYGNTLQQISDRGRTALTRVVPDILKRIDAAEGQTAVEQGLSYDSKINKDIERAWKNPEVAYQVTAYHGSPHQAFDRFSTQYIGSGEGAQAFGWGLYFTDLKEISQYYRETLADQPPPKVLWTADRPIEAYLEELNYIQNTVTSLWEMGYSTDVLSEETYSEIFQAVEETKRELEEARRDEQSERYIDTLVVDLELLENVKSIWDDVKIDVDYLRGTGYKVSIDVEPEELLALDKKLNEQTEYVKDAIKKLFDANVFGTDPGMWDRLTGKKFQDFLVAQFEDAPEYELQNRHMVEVLGEDYAFMPAPERVSRYLNSLGIKGNKYLAGPSRKKGEGANNYVVWDDTLIDVVERFSVSPSPLYQKRVLQKQTATETQNFLDHRLSSYTPNALPQLSSLAAEIDEIVNRLTGGKTPVKFQDYIKIENRQMAAASGDPDAQTAAGVYDTFENLITIALDDSLYDPRSTAFHEAFHALEFMGVLIQNEIDLMVENQDLLESMASLALDVPLGSDVITNMEPYEVRAVAFQYYADRASRGRTKGFEGKLKTVWDKVLEFFQKVKNLLHGRGFQSIQDIFEAIYVGEVGKRTSHPSGVHKSQALSPYSVTQLDPDSIQDFIWRETRFWDAWKQPGRSKLSAIQEGIDTFRMYFQDRYLPLLRMQEAIEHVSGTSLAHDMNPYATEEGFTSRAGAKLRDLQEFRESILEIMGDHDLSLEAVEVYLYAKHAEERNDHIAQINPDLQEAGSGMSTEDAEVFVDMAESGPDGAAYRQIHDLVQEVVKYDRDNRVETGLWSSDTRDVLESTYQHYVPLKGWKEIEPSDRLSSSEAQERINRMFRQRVRSGQGYSIRGKEGRRATGRSSMAANLLTNAFMQAEEGVVRGEKNRVLQAFWRMVTHAIDNLPGADEVFRIDELTMRPVINKETGLVSYRNLAVKDAEQEVETLYLKVQGQEISIRLVGDENMDIIRNLKNMEASQADFLLKHLSPVSRMLSTLYTTLSPSFVVVNFFRDLQTAMINLGEKTPDVEGLRAKVLKDVMRGQVVRGIFRQQYRKEDSGNAAVNEWMHWFDQYERAGGKVSFWKMDDLKSQVEELKRDLRERQAGLISVANAKRMLRNTVDGIEAMNISVENAVRLSTFRRLVEGGMSEREAASFSKNLTVNFNRRGELSTSLNTVWLFFNASIQGTARLLQATMRNPKLKYLITTMAAAGFTMDMLASMVAGGDGEDDNWYDRMNEHVKDRYMVIPVNWSGDDNSYISIPLAYGYGIVYQWGRLLSEMVRGKTTPAKAFMKMIRVSVNDMTPIQFIAEDDEELLASITPTFGRPFVEIMSNRNFMGSYIMPPEFPGDYTPDFRRFYPGVSAPSKWAAQQAYNITDGGLDLSPESIDHVVKTYSGGLGDFIVRHFPYFGSNWQQESLGKEPTSKSPERWPLIRKVLKEESVEARKGMAYNRIGEVSKAKEKLQHAIEVFKLDPTPENKENLDTVRKKTLPYMRLESLSKATRRALRKINARRKAARAKLEGQKKIDFLRNLREQDDVIVSRFNNAYARSIRKIEQPRSWFILEDEDSIVKDRLGRLIKEKPDEVKALLSGAGQRLTPTEIADAAEQASPALANLLRQLEGKFFNEDA